MGTARGFSITGNALAFLRVLDAPRPYKALWTPFQQMQLNANSARCS